MDHYFREIWDINFNAFEKMADRARPQDLCETDVIRIINLAKAIELKIGREDRIVVKRPFVE